MSKDFHNSIQNVINDDKPTIRKSLIIGIGGSGMKGALAVKKWIEGNMPDEAFSYLRYIGIDTTDIETSIEGKGGRYRFPSDQFFQEAKRMLYIAAPTPSELSLDFLREKFQKDPVFNWLPNPDVYDISTRSGQGANQTRPLGRLAFYFNEKKLRETLVKERDRLAELPDEPKFFQLLDIKEGEDKKDEIIAYTIEKGKNRYYFRDKIPADHTISYLEPHEKIRALLSPHTDKKLDLESFPKDAKGYYFEINSDNFAGRTFAFRVRHSRRGGQISVFITCSIVGGTGNGMILDLAAMIKDIFKDYWPTPRIYGILVLPSAFKRVVYNRNAKANAYAALKEIDYFMSGNNFKATYPSGKTIEVPDRIFDEGMLYLLDIENMAGNSLQGRDQVQELTGQFIATFVASVVGGAIEERMVNDSTRASIYLPKESLSKRKAIYNSFGISRVLYPVPILTQLGYKITAVKLAESFLKNINPRLLLETIGDINRGLVRSLRLNCRLIFERMYPDYLMDIDVEFKSMRQRLQAELSKKNLRGAASLLERIIRDYSKEEQEKIKNNLVIKMEKRYQLELEKIKSILTTSIHSFLKDPQKGFLFAEEVINLLLGKLELYQKKYYKERVSLARYSQEEMEKRLAEVEKGGNSDPKFAESIIDMNNFNFAQLIFESMLTASESFVREFKSMLYNLKNLEVNILKNKVLTLITALNEEVRKDKFELLEKKNPLFFYLVNDKEIGDFLNNYFYSKLSIEDLCNDIDFVKMDREDNAQQIIESHLIMTDGLSVLDKSASEIQEIIRRRYGDIQGKSIQELQQILSADFTENGSEEGYQISDSSMNKIEVENIRKKLFQIIHKRFQGFNFENMSIKEILDQKKVPVQKLLEKLDSFSRPYIFLDPTGLNSMEYYRVVTNFKLNTYEEGEDPNAGAGNDLPARMDHYKKRESALPNISVETFEVPNLCKPYEIISIGLLLGFPIFKINSLTDSANDYHELLAEKSHPLHNFNHPSFDARYFPDPMLMTNYLNPARLWEGLLELQILKQTTNGYEYEKEIHDTLKEMEARENYKKVILNIFKKIEASGGIEKASLDIVAEAINGLAMLAKSPASGKLQFRREYSLVIRDIIDGDGTDDKAREQKLSKDQYIEKFIQNPEFENLDELAVFLENQFAVRDFILGNIKKIIDTTKANVTAGASITIPKSKWSSITLPLFKDNYSFYDYFEHRGSLEWQNFLKNRLVDKLNRLVQSSRFRLESDPTLVDRKKINDYLDSLAGKVPEIALWEVKVENKIIK